MFWTASGMEVNITQWTKILSFVTYVQTKLQSNTGPCLESE